MEFFNSVIEFFNSPVFRLILNLVILFLIVLYISLAKWTYADAKRRGAMAFYWAIVALLFPMFGWIVYLIVRPPEFIDEVRERELEIRTKEAILNDGGLNCPSCHNHIEKDFLICPSCRRRLKNSCPSCGRALSTSWAICPYCQQIL